MDWGNNERVFEYEDVVFRWNQRSVVITLVENTKVVNANLRPKVKTE